MENDIVKAKVRQYLGSHMRIFRHHKALSQDAMADRLHVSQRALGKLENGVNTFSLLTFVRFYCIMDKEEQTPFLQGLCGIIIECDEE